MIIQTLTEKFLRKLFAISNCRKCIRLENGSVDGPGLDLQRLAKHEPDRLASEIMEADEIAVQRILLHDIDPRRKVRPPPDLTIRQYVVDLARIAGFRPTKRQPVPAPRKYGRQ